MKTTAARLPRLSATQRRALDAVLTSGRGAFESSSGWNRGVYSKGPAMFFTGGYGAFRWFIQLYTVTTCERCGCRLMGANSINAQATLSLAAEAGLTVDAAPPEEGGYCEAFDQVTCMTCYAD